MKIRAKFVEGIKKKILTSNTLQKQMSLDNPNLKLKMKDLKAVNHVYKKDEIRIEIVNDIVTLEACKHAYNEVLAYEDVCEKVELDIKDLGEVWRGNQEKLAEKF